MVKIDTILGVERCVSQNSDTGKINWEFLDYAPIGLNKFPMTYKTIRDMNKNRANIDRWLSKIMKTKSRIMLIYKDYGN